MEALVCGSLGVSGWMYEWHNEPTDSISMPAVQLGTMQDCEDTAVSVVGSFIHLKKMNPYDVKNSMARKILMYLQHMSKEACMAAGHVDVVTANPKEINPEGITGHAFPIIILNKEYRPLQQHRVFIIESTNPFYPHEYTGRDIYKSILKTKLPDNDCINIYPAPQFLPSGKYKTITNLFYDDRSHVIGPKGQGCEWLEDDPFMVGVECQDFLRGDFEERTYATPTFIKQVQTLWKDFQLVPNLEMLPKLQEQLGLHQFRLKSNQWSHAKSRQLQAHNAMSAFYINKNNEVPAGCHYVLPTTDIVVVGGDRIKPDVEMNLSMDKMIEATAPPPYDMETKLITRHARR